MAGFAVGTAGRPPEAQAPATFASAPARPTAATLAPVRLAAAARSGPAVVAAGRRHARSASSPLRARLAVEPMSFASAQAPAAGSSALTSMVTMLRRLPRSAVAPRGLISLQHVLASAEPVQSGPETHVVAFTRSVQAEARVLTVGGTLSEEEAAEIRRAVIQAAAEGRKLKFRLVRPESPAGGGGQGSGFDINIQTLVKGE
jgi:hypothetical protein